MTKLMLHETNDMVETVQRKYMQAYNTGDLDGLVDLYTEDAIFFPGIGPIGRGKQEIRATFEMMKGGFATIDVQCLQVEECPDRPFNIGLFTFMNDKGEKAAGNYLIIYKKEEGTWKIYIHTVNQDKG
jgi:uncharacterized protein (TIGR02246 family)